MSGLVIRWRNAYISASSECEDRLIVFVRPGPELDIEQCGFYAMSIYCAPHAPCILLTSELMPLL